MILHKSAPIEISWISGSPSSTIIDVRCLKRVRVISNVFESAFPVKIQTKQKSVRLTFYIIPLLIKCGVSIYN